MNVVAAVCVDDGGANLCDDSLDRSNHDPAVADAEAGVRKLCVKQSRGHELGRTLGLDGPLGDAPPSLPAGEGEDIHVVASGAVSQEDPATADLHVIGM